MLPCQVMLTGVKLITTFAKWGEMYSKDSREAACVMISRFCTVHGLPQLVLVDDESEFKDMTIKTCQVLAIPYYIITKKNHKSILLEQFH